MSLTVFLAVDILKKFGCHGWNKNLYLALCHDLVQTLLGKKYSQLYLIGKSPRNNRYF